MNFNDLLNRWYNTNKRDLPWRNTQNPYIIWLSEVILQQTRVEQGLPYFHRFLEKFPDITSFADAREEEILKCWQGLGYYSRARNMHKAAQMVMNDFDGIFPADYNSLLKLPGVGEYTAAAISSFCYNEVKPVLDGNVFRFISRLKGIEVPINSPSAKKIFIAILNDLINKKDPANFNQAMMEFGARHCTPSKPLCAECPFAEQCIAFRTNETDRFPVKNAKKAARERTFNYLFIDMDKITFLKKRSGSDIWKNLYEFPMMEGEQHLVQEHLDKEYGIKTSEEPELLASMQHQLSHQKIKANFFKISVKSDYNLLKTDIFETEIAGISKYPVHRLMEKFCQEYFS